MIGSDSGCGRGLGSVVGSDGIDDDKTDIMALQGDGQLVGQDVVLGFEVGEGIG